MIEGSPSGAGCGRKSLPPWCSTFERTGSSGQTRCRVLLRPVLRLCASPQRAFPKSRCCACRLNGCSTLSRPKAAKLQRRAACQDRVVQDEASLKAHGSCRPMRSCMLARGAHWLLLAELVLTWCDRRASGSCNVGARGIHAHVTRRACRPSVSNCRRSSGCVDGGGRSALPPHEFAPNLVLT